MSECTCGAENVKLYGQHYLGCPLQPTSHKAPRDELAEKIDSLNWRQCPPHLKAAYDQLKAERDALAAQLADQREKAMNASDNAIYSYCRAEDLKAKLADATELIERMTGGAVRRDPSDSEIAGER